MSVDPHYKALLIGNGVFDRDPQQLPPLRGPANDVRIFSAALTHSEFGIFDGANVRAIVDGNESEVSAATDAFFSEALPNDYLLFYYSGHGYPDINNRLFLCLRDTQTRRLATSALWGEAVNAMAQNSRAQKFIFVLDCCYSGGFKGGTSASQFFGTGSGRCVFTCCASDQLAADAKIQSGASAFTHFFSEALIGGDIVAEPDDLVLTSTIFKFVAPRVFDLTQQQVQWWPDKTFGDLVLARRNQRKPAAPLQKDAGQPARQSLSVFISYRHVEPDETIAHQIQDHLSALGHRVFIDTGIGLGENWVDAIRTALEKADAFVVLLSAESILSDMVRKEIAFAHRLAMRSDRPLRIVPIRIQLTGDLPYDLGAYLDRIQYRLWRGAEDTAGLLKEVAGAVVRQLEAPPVRTLPVRFDQELGGDVERKESGAPLPAADPRAVASTEEGAVKLESQFYVRRKSDAVAELSITEKHPTVVVRGQRQMGKSSLLARINAQAQRAGERSCYIDFQMLDERHFQTLDTLFTYLARRLHREFSTKLAPKDAWDDLEGPKANFTNFVEDALLRPSQQHLRLVFDEVERVFRYPAYRDEFFSAVRGWHNLGATNERFQRLSVVVSHATSATHFIQDLNQSPFNVGTRIELEGFTLNELHELNERYREPLKDDDALVGFQALVGGHPYLARQGLYTLASSGWSVAVLREKAQLATGPFADHLKSLSWQLRSLPAAKEGVTRLIHQKQLDETTYQQMWALGLITGSHPAVAKFRCLLYEDYFKAHT